MRICSAAIDCENADLYIIKIIGLASKVVPTAMGKLNIIRYLKDFSYEYFNNSLEDTFNRDNNGNIALT